MKKNSNSINIQINDHELKNGIIFYKVSIHDTKNQDKWNSITRYSYLRDLHLQIEEILTNLKKKCPKFPDKKWFGNTEPQFISQRQTELQYYFNMLIDQYDLDIIQPLKQFLFKNKIDKKLEKDPLSKMGSQFDENKSPNKDKLKNKEANLGFIVEKSTQNFVSLADTYQPPEQEYVIQRKIQYNKINIEFKNSFFDKFYQIPKGKELNSIPYQDKSFPKANQKFIQNLQQFCSKIDTLLNLPKMIADSTEIVLQLPNKQ